MNMVFIKAGCYLQLLRPQSVAQVQAENPGLMRNGAPANMVSPPIRGARHPDRQAKEKAKCGHFAFSEVVARGRFELPTPSL